jgi:hypothetical protein
MYNSTILLQNLNTLLPLESLSKSAKDLQTDKYCKHFNTRILFLVLITAQAKGWISLRDIQSGFSSHSNSLYHLGMKNIPCKSTISDANTRVNPIVFESLFRTLVSRVLSFQSQVPNKFKKVVRLIDSSLVEVSLGLFDWAKFRKTKGAIKIHAQYNFTSQIPEVVCITDGKVHDIKSPLFQAGFDFSDSIIVFDRGYHDFALYNTINKQHGVFVTRLKKGIKFELIGQHRACHGNVLKDNKIRLISDITYNKYSSDLRLVEYKTEDGKVYRFLTNNFQYSAQTIADLYKSRWQIELFFKWMKQHLKIKTFFGTSKNAVMNQIWIALIYYTLLKYVMHQANFKGTALELTRIIKENLFAKGTILDYLKVKVISQVIQTVNPLYESSLFNTS